MSPETSGPPSVPVGTTVQSVAGRIGSAKNSSGGDPDVPLSIARIITGPKPAVTSLNPITASFPLTARHVTGPLSVEITNDGELTTATSNETVPPGFAPDGSLCASTTMFWNWSWPVIAPKGAVVPRPETKSPVGSAAAV